MKNYKATKHFMLAFILTILAAGLVIAVIPAFGVSLYILSAFFGFATIGTATMTYLE